MEVYILASGSQGNCTIIKDDDEIIMLDLGISYKKLLEKLNKIQVDINAIKHILITHEHMDHSRGIKTFYKENIGEYFYLTKGTNKALLNQDIKIPCFVNLKTDIEIDILNFKITPITLSHDAKEPVGFVIKKDNKKIVYITDTGFISSDYDDLLKDATLYIFEANHDINMLMNTPKRPYHTKLRILSEKGHMSNDYACKKINQLVSKKSIWAVFHISKDCNSIDEIEKSICKNFDNPYKIKPIYTSQEIVKIKI